MIFSKINTKALSQLRKGLLVLLLSLCGTVLFGCAKTSEPPPPDTVPPVFHGVRDIEVLLGEGFALRTGVTAVDAVDGEVTFTVDASAVDPDRAGVYTVVYRAVDASGNEAVQTATVTVKGRSVSADQLWSVIDPVIAQQGWSSQTLAKQCEALYYYIKATLSYTSTSDKSDWVAEAYRGMTEHTGDCFTYYAVARAFFERLGVSVMTVTRTPGVLPTAHYWLLINTGAADAPAWYHWDACPHPMEYPLTSILLTDAQLLAYNQKVEHYYTFDPAQYPATPTEKFS